MSSIEPTQRRIQASGLLHRVLTWDGRARSSQRRVAGETAVLCHGFLDLAFSWHAVAQPLAEAGMRVVAFDFRGHGETEWVGKGGYYHFPDYVLDLTELVPALCEEPVHLVGHSMGGTACAYYAGTRPGTLRSLTLVEGIGPPAPDLSVTPDRYAAFARTVREARARGPRRVASHEEALARLRVTSPGLGEALGQRVATEATRPAPDGDGLVWRFDPLHRTTSPFPFVLDAFLAFLERVRVPTLVVGGERGFRVEGETARRARIPDQRLVEIPGAGHMLHHEAPEALADAFLGFAEALPRAPGAT